MKKVSAIIPAYNAARFIGQAIESILGQTYKEIEIIVVDDGSSDGTQEAVCKFGENIKYIKRENKGHAMARNTGLKASTGYYCAFLDADDTWAADKTELQVAAIEQDSNIGIVHCDIEKVDELGKSLGRFKRKKKFIDGMVFEPLLLRKGHIATSSALFRRECFERLGMLDETMREYGNEDREFWLRISKKYVVRYLDEILVNYRILENSLSRSRNIERMTRGRYMTIEKSLEEIKPSIYYQFILKRRAFSAIHRELGDDLLNRKEFVSARRQYLKSISYNPFTFWSWVNLMKSVAKINVG